MQHRMFIQSDGIFVGVFDLVKALSPSAQDEVVQNLAFWLNSVHSSCRADPSVRNFLLVGTHKDQLTGPDVQKRLRDFSARLERQLDRHDAMRRLIRPDAAAAAGEDHPLLFFAVTCDTRGGEDRMLAAVRHAIMTSAEALPALQEERPILWLRVLNRLQETGREVMTLSEARQIADAEAMRFKGRAMTEDEARVMLETLHAIGEVICFYGLMSDPGKNLVVLQPLWAARMFRQVLVRADLEPGGHGLLLHRPGDPLPPGFETRAELLDAWTRYTETGVIGRRLLEVLWKEGPEHREATLKLLEAMEMICQVPGKADEGEAQRWFVPCLPLATASREGGAAGRGSIAEDQRQEGQPEEQLCRFDFSGFLPAGMLPRALLAGLRATHRRYHGLAAEVRMWDLPRLYRNQAIIQAYGYQVILRVDEMDNCIDCSIRVSRGYELAIQHRVAAASLLRDLMEAQYTSAHLALIKIDVRVYHEGTCKSLTRDRDLIPPELRSVWAQHTARLSETPVLPAAKSRGQQGIGFQASIRWRSVDCRGSVVQASELSDRLWLTSRDSHSYFVDVQHEKQRVEQQGKEKKKGPMTAAYVITSCAMEVDRPSDSPRSQAFFKLRLGLVPAASINPTPGDTLWYYLAVHDTGGFFKGYPDWTPDRKFLSLILHDDSNKAAVWAARDSPPSSMPAAIQTGGSVLLLDRSLDSSTAKLTLHRVAAVRGSRMVLVPGAHTEGVIDEILWTLGK